MVRELADALHQRGRLVHMHKQVFPDRTPDRVWIPEVARGWIIVTRDKRLQTRHIEWMALLRAKARVLWVQGRPRLKRGDHRRVPHRAGEDRQAGRDPAGAIHHQGHARRARGAGVSSRRRELRANPPLCGAGNPTGAFGAVIAHPSMVKSANTDGVGCNRLRKKSTSRLSNGISQGEEWKRRW